ncbi:MAG: RNA 2'-phosphotransferase [Balneolaceae bacterium]
MNQLKVSRFLSLILRHKPDTIGITLDEYGWVSTNELLEKINETEFELSFEDLKLLVELNDKQRFTFSSDKSKIRANQGHSLSVNLELLEKQAPAILYHGTTQRNIPSILEQGLLKQQRHHVHLSSDPLVAEAVGRRYGKPIVLKINAAAMVDQGVKFYLSENNVWLTDYIHPDFIEITE